MRELTKSVFSFSWALSVFGAQQTLNLLSPQKAANAFNEVTRATEKQLTGITESAFKSVDSLQRQVVDSTFNVMSVESLNPSRWVSIGNDIVQRTIGLLGQVVPGVGSCGSSQPTGWGPVGSPKAQ